MAAVIDECREAGPEDAKKSAGSVCAASQGAPKIPLRPKNPERICWGCDKYCPANDLRCGNGTIRTPHPAELFGDDWDEIDSSASVAPFSQQAE